MILPAVLWRFVLLRRPLAKKMALSVSAGMAVILGGVAFMVSFGEAESILKTLIWIVIAYYILKFGSEESVKPNASPDTHGDSTKAVSRYSKRAFICLFYVAIVVFGFAYGYTSVSSQYYLDGQNVSSRMSSTRFIENNISEVYLRTQINLNRPATIYTGEPVQFFPTAVYEVDVGNGNAIAKIVTLIVIVLLFLIGFSIHLATSRQLSQP